MAKNYDTLVVGGGLAGLMAARELTAAGQSVLVLEASAHLGGRTRTIQTANTTFDVGGQWTGPGQPRLGALIEEFGLDTHPTHVDGKRVMDIDGRVSTYQGTIPKMAPWKLLVAQLGVWRIEKLCREVSLQGPWTDEQSVDWDGITASAWLKRTVRSADVVAVVNAAVRVVFGADLNELSFLHFLYYFHSGGGFTKLVESAEGNQDRVIVGGSQQVSHRLAEQAGTVLTNAPVTQLNWSEDGVVAVARGEQWRARHAIVAVPLAISGRILYQPALPTLRDQLVQRVSMGATVKCIVLYTQPFWREKGLSGEAVCTQGPVSVVFDNTSPSGQAGLVAFVAGAPARGWSEREVLERRQAVLDCLVRCFGEAAGKPVDYIEQDWAAEPYIGGAPTGNFPPGTLSVFGPALREPVGPIHWAGTETALESTGFMEGALESGQRAAQEVLAIVAESNVESAE